MSIFEWSPIYETGVADIDRQHMRLMVYVNEMFDALITDRGEEVIDHILGELIAYTKEHFDYEEELLRRGGDANVASHIAGHQALLGAVEGLKARRDAGDVKVNGDTLELLRDWLVSHIRDDDAGRAPVIRHGAAS